MPNKVMIIDDETDFCLIMKSYFIRKGYTINCSHNIRDGLLFLRNYLPDILFLDNNLPDGKGWDEVGKIVEIIPHVRIFLVSAHRDPDSFLEKNENIIAWQKPITMSLLNEFFGNDNQTLQKESM
jgi:two-component SAPR family response regulator